MTSTILTVSQVNTYLKSVIEQDSNLQNIYITGEISNFISHYKSGHCYFTLKDENAAVKAVMFRTAASRLRFTPENGMKVLIRGSISLYERDGVYQLYCEDMIPEGIGELAAAFEQMKEKLEKMGLFRPEHKKPLPAYPERIGVVTSAGGAALQDIINVITRRYPCGQIVLESVAVQGIGAAQQIAKAIDKFNLLKGADVIIVGRGGGSAEDLWAFNEEIVALAVYNSDIPVISAVGHETDFTIIDFVSDMRAPTPSAAAELAVPDVRDVLFSLDKELDSMTECLDRILDSYRMKLLAFENILTAHSPKNSYELYSQLLTACEEKLKTLFGGRVDFYTNALVHYTSRLEASSPLRLLSRGYCIVEDENTIPVRSIGSVSEGDKIKIIMCDGSLDCTVESKTATERK